MIKSKGIKAEHLSFEESCHSVEEAANTVGADPEDFVKSIVMVNNKNEIIVGIVKGEDKVSTKHIGDALGIEKPSIAPIEDILELTGYPLGGTPGFGFDAVFLIDPKVMKKEMVYLGGGSDCSLTYMSTDELVKANNGKIIRIRK
ncbi:hypothetical protein GF319_07970 [Candidatus Bathyarchaeota archaeon]|nr:hypothetical protein [Candidatus Bathyarchaeota archaeon]